MYDVYIGKMLVPVSPSSITMKINNKNKTMVLINQGEVNIPKKAGLTEISFDLLLPNSRWPFARYDGGFHSADYYLKNLEKLKTGKKKFQFIVNRELPTGANLYATNITCVLEDYTVKDSTDEGFDAKVSVKLKQYVPFKTQTCKIKGNKKKKAKSSSTGSRNTKAANDKDRTYTVASGDTLWGIAKKFYGDGSKYSLIQSANGSKISNPNSIQVGLSITIPAEA
jgi:LysM repeat protein